MLEMRKAGNVGSQWENKRKPARMGHRPCPLVCLGWTSSPSFVSSVRSSSVYPGLLPTYIPSHFFQIFQIWSYAAYIHYTFINHFHFDSVFNLQNRTRQYFCMNYIHACTSFFKILQGSSNFCKTQHVLYLLNAGGSRISNMTFP